MPISPWRPNSSRYRPGSRWSPSMMMGLPSLIAWGGCGWVWVWVETRKRVRWWNKKSWVRWGEGRSGGNGGVGGGGWVDG